MTQPLLRNKKVWKNSKGVSGIIAAIFLVLVVFFLYANVFTFILIQNTSFQEVVSEVNQRDIDRSIEKITVSNVNYTVAGDQVRVAAQVKNDGPVSVQIVTLWVVDTTIQKYGYNDTLNINMKSGDTLVFTGSNALTVTIKDSNSLDVFTSWFVTDRGSLIPLEKEKGIIVAELAQGIGSMALDFYTFRYYTYETDPSNKLKKYPVGNVNFTIPHNEPVAFGVVLTNLDPSKQTITLDKYSQVWLYCSEAIGAVQAEPPVWYIVTVDENGIVQASYSDISINYSETKLIIFASKSTGSFSKMKLTKTDYKNKLFAVNLMLHGKLGDNDYGQNIPFVSLYVYG